jgi:2'-5' RNA ligase
MSGQPGTSSGRRQSALLIPVPEAEGVVGRYRAEYDPVAASGVPAHITLVVPWLPPDQISDGDLDELRDALAGTGAFDFSLDAVSWFGRSVLWLAPSPAKPFQALTAVLAERFSTPPYDDEFDEVVPHLTVGHASDGVELAPVAAALAEHLPVKCRAEQVWVMVSAGPGAAETSQERGAGPERPGTEWSVRARVALG